MRAAAYASAADLLRPPSLIDRPSPGSPRPMPDHPRHERMLNVPAVVVALLAVLVLVHALVMLALTAEETTEFLLLFAFIPARYDASVMPDVAWPGGWAGGVWTLIIYSLIHADLTHLAFNAVWFLAFG